MDSYQGGVLYDDSANSFQGQAQNIASNIKKISQNVLSMSKMVNQLQTPQDSTELRLQLRQIQNYTQKLAKDTSSMLMALMKVPTDQPGQKLSRDRLSDEYMATLNSFQSTQKLAAQKTKEDVKKVKNAQPISISDPFGANSQSRELVEMDEPGIRRQEQMTAQAERSLRDLEQSEQDYRQLENDIMDVNQIFKELGTMIHAQGATVESIESHVEYTAQAVEAGTTQLTEAHNYKNKLRKKKVYIAIILAIVISIILILIFNH